MDREVLLKEREEKLIQEKQKSEELERRKQSAAAAQVSNSCSFIYNQEILGHLPKAPLYVPKTYKYVIHHHIISDHMGITLLIILHFQ